MLVILALDAAAARRTAKLDAARYERALSDSRAECQRLEERCRTLNGLCRALWDWHLSDLDAIAELNHELDSLREQQEGTEPAWTDAGTFRIVYYCPCEQCAGKRPGDPGYGLTRSGTTATPGRTVAVDPSVIPLGSAVRIDGQEYIAEDTGVTGNTIDVFVESHAEALRLGTHIASIAWRDLT